MNKYIDLKKTTLTSRSTIARNQQHLSSELLSKPERWIIRDTQSFTHLIYTAFQKKKKRKKTDAHGAGIAPGAW